MLHIELNVKTPDVECKRMKEIPAIYAGNDLIHIGGGWHCYSLSLPFTPIVRYPTPPPIYLYPLPSYDTSPLQTPANLPYSAPSSFPSHTYSPTVLFPEHLLPFPAIIYPTHALSSNPFPALLPTPSPALLPFPCPPTNPFPCPPTQSLPLPS